MIILQLLEQSSNIFTNKYLNTILHKKANILIVNMSIIPCIKKEKNKQTFKQIQYS